MMMHHYIYPIWLQKVTKNQKIWKKDLIFEDLTLHCDFEDRNPTFPHDTLGYDDATSYQVWLHIV